MAESTETLHDFGIWPIEDDTTFPVGFFDIGEMTFEEVYNTRKVFVEFIKLVDDASGLFCSFQTYCLDRG